MASGQPQFRYTQPPSKVIHLRNLPWDCTEEELVELGSPFGKVVNTKCNVGANRNQAFVEFVSIRLLSVLCGLQKRFVTCIKLLIGGFGVRLF
jgi:RNA recognition motif-containing protein